MVSIRLKCHSMLKQHGSRELISGGHWGRHDWHDWHDWHQHPWHMSVHKLPTHCVESKVEELSSTQSIKYAVYPSYNNCGSRKWVPPNRSFPLHAIGSCSTWMFIVGPRVKLPERISRLFQWPGIAPIPKRHLRILQYGDYGDYGYTQRHQPLIDGISV